jgi:hypothetical protein
MRKLVAGIKNIVTDEFGARGKVDIIDFQSMPDGMFKFLLNYVDHGVKKLMSILLAAKQVSSNTFGLLSIFTKQGLPKPTMVGTSQDRLIIKLGTRWCYRLSSSTLSSMS